jgi:hypothetical protein
MSQNFNSENLNPFQKGESGNPNGRPKGALSLKTIIRNKLEEGDKAALLADRLVNMATEKTTKDSDALNAITEILDRLEGKATQRTEDVTQQPKQLVIVRHLEK